MSLRILLVDDNRLIAYSLQRELSVFGYEVTTAHSAEEALQVAKSEKPDLLLMDVNLNASKDGIDLVRQIHATLGFTPNIYLTGYSVEDLHAHLQSTSPMGVLEKPVDSRHLRRIIESMLVT
jgi:CheY-like chemotaxis protein